MDISHLIDSFVGILNEMSPYILLGFLIAGLLHVFVNEATLTKHLSGNGWKPIIKAAAIGVPLPLCSCGVLPTAVSLRRQGASKGATTSFLIATPQTGVDSIAATYSLLGLAFAIIRPIAALIGAVFGGMSVDKMTRNEDNNSQSSCGNYTSSTFTTTDSPCDSSANSACTNGVATPLHRKFIDAGRYAFLDMIDSMGKWLVIGLVIASLITIFVPESLFVGLRQFPLAAMVIVVLIAIPMYICATGSIPIAMSLMLKGLTPGVAFVLLMAGPAANFASILILNKTIGRKSTAIYVGSVVVTALIFGLIIDYLLPSSWFELRGSVADHCGHDHSGWFAQSCSVILIILLLYSAVKTINFRRKKTNIETTKDMTDTFNIIGMNCAHCRTSVQKAISEVKGVESVEVDLSRGTAVVKGNYDRSEILNAVRMAGFEVKE